MFVYTLDDYETYVDFVWDLLHLDQPVYLYDSPTNEKKILVSSVEVDEENIDTNISKIENKQNITDIVDDDEPLFDYDDPDDEWLLFL